MSASELASVFRRRPYVPVRLHVTGDVHYDVYEPEMAMIGMSILFLGQKRDVASEYFDEPVLIALRHITRAEPLVDSLTA